MRAGLAAVSAASAIGCGRIGFDALSDAATADAPLVEPAGLIARWPLDEGTGMQALDVIGDAHGTLSAIGGALEPTWTSGHRGSALMFAGDGDRVLTGLHDQLNNLPAFTLSAWVRPTALSILNGAHSVIDKGSPTNGWAFGVADHFDGDLWFRAAYPNSRVQRSSAGGMLVTGRWFFIAASWDGRPTNDSIAIYLDGVEVPPAYTEDSTEPRPDDATNDLTINNNGSTGYAGAIDDARVYGRILSADEIATIYAATK